MVNYEYSRQLWLAYQTGKAPAPSEKIEKAADGTADEIAYLPALPSGCTPRPDRQLLLIGGAGHGFLMNRKNHPKSLFAAEEFLKGYTEVLTIDVQLTDRIMERHGLKTHLELPFTGSCRSPCGFRKTGVQGQRFCAGNRQDNRSDVPLSRLKIATSSEI